MISVIGRMVVSSLLILFQGSDLSAGTQALPVGKIIEPKIFRKDDIKV